MRTRLLNLLRCPACLGKLHSISFVTSDDDDEVVEGVLVCACGESYPVVRTIPRMLRNAYTLFPEFVTRYGDRSEYGIAEAARRSAVSSPPVVVAKTQESFGYQWTKFS